MDGKHRKREDRKRQLLEELRKIQQQKAELYRQLESLKSRPAPSIALPTASVKAPLESPPGFASGGMKRPNPDSMVETVAAKRARSAADRQQRTQALMQQCGKIVKELMQLKDAYAFREPVDPVKLNIPDYFTIIKNPMDLSTVQKKIADKKYKTPMEVRDDVRLIWSNAATYNPKNNPVHLTAERMANTFEKKWYKSEIEARWNEESSRQKDEELELSGKPAVATAPGVTDKVKELDAELKNRVQSKLKYDKGSVDPARPLSNDEKRKLSYKLGQLPEDKLTRVLEIVQESHQTQVAHPSGDGEIELEMDQLSEGTLRKLWDYVDSLNRPVAKSGKDNRQVSKENGPPVGNLNRGPIRAQQAPSKPDKPRVANGPGGLPQRREESNSSDSSSSDNSSGSSTDSESDQAVSAERVGSTMGDPNETKHPSSGVGDGREQTLGVAGSQTKPPDQPAFMKAKSAHPKPEMPIKNVAAWSTAALHGAENGRAAAPLGARSEARPSDPEELRIWEDYRTVNEKKEARRKEQEEEEARRQAAARQEEEERLAKVKEEKEAARRAEEEKERLEREQREQERRATMAALQNYKGTANVANNNVMSDYQIIDQSRDMSALGLARRADDDNEIEDNFDE